MRKTVFIKEPGDKEIGFDYSGRGQKADVFGLLIAEGDDVYRLKVKVVHKESDTSGRIVIKGIVKDRAKVEIESLLKVERSLNNIKNKLEIRLLLVGEKSQGFAEPRLEIESNAVNIGHSVTIGRIRQEEVDYLQSRGIEEGIAKKMLIRGFLREELEFLSPEDRGIVNARVA